MFIPVTFPEGKRVDARVGRFVVQTDQPAALGGTESAPAPFELFLASIATCAGIYALGFCQVRQISTEGLGLTVWVDDDPDTHLPRGFRLEVTPPVGFPEKYRAALLKAVDGCKVKKTIAALPQFQTVYTAPMEPECAVA